MAARGGLGNQLLNDDVEHRARRKRQRHRQNRREPSGQQHRHNRRSRLDRARERAHGKRPEPAHALAAQRQGDDRALREVLNRDAQRQRQRAGHRGDAARAQASQHHAHSHALGDVVQRHGEHHHGRLAQTAAGTLRLVAVHVQVRHEPVQRQQERHAQQEAARRRRKRQPAQLRAVLHRRDEQRPHGGRHHHAGGKAQQRLVDALAQAAPEHKYARGAQRRTQKGKHNPHKRPDVHHRIPFLFVAFFTLQVRALRLALCCHRRPVNPSHRPAMRVPD